MAIRPLIIGCVIATIAATSGLLPDVKPAHAAGLDFVVLVDVSGSMYHHRDSATDEVIEGSDPARLRWDAVKMILDLLTEEDRILILPFNGHCPARYSGGSDDKEMFVPGTLPLELQTAEHEVRTDLGKRIFSFIHSERYDQDAWPEIFNGDHGATGILEALGTAKHKIEDASAERGRQRLVILLTDGAQLTSSALQNALQSKKPDELDLQRLIEMGKLKREELDADERLVWLGGWKNDPRVSFYVDKKIPVHTIGFGKKTHSRFLGELAAITKGGLELLNSNERLVERVRELVWSERNCWTAEIDVSHRIPEAISSGSLDGITDFAVLMYEVDDSQLLPGQPRVAFAPDPPPALTWQGLDTLPRPQARSATGKPIPLRDGGGLLRESGYAYHYFDGRLSPEDQAPGALFARTSGLQLKLEFAPEQRQKDIRGYFIKRGPRFRISLDGSQFYRHQPIPLRVIYENPGENQSCYDYQVNAELFAIHAPDSRVRVVMRPASKTEFVCPEESGFTAASLPSPSGFQEYVDNYILRIELRENTPQKGSPYRHVLPLQTVAVKNVVLFESVPTIQLNRSSQTRQVVLRQCYPYSGELPLVSKIKYPSLEDASATLGGKEIVFSPRPDASTQLRITARNGAASFQLGLNSGNLPKPGKYPGGMLSFDRGESALFRIATIDSQTGQERIGPVAVPFEIELGTVGIEFSSPQTWRPLTVGADRIEDSQIVTVQLMDDQTSGNGVQPPSIKLVRLDNDATEFAPQELWLEPITVEEGAVADRSQQLKLEGFRQPVRVVFHPDTTKHPDDAQLVGTHRYMLVASGTGLDPAEVYLDVVVQPPVIEVRKSEASELQLSPDRLSTPVSHQLRTTWLPGGKLPLTLDPPFKSISFHALDAESKPTDRVTPIAYTGVEPPLLLNVVGKDEARNDAGWASLDFIFRLPQADKIAFGHYAGEVHVLLQDQPCAALPFRMAVDGIHVLHPVVMPDERRRFGLDAIPPQRQQKIEVLQALGQRVTETIAVRSELGLPLDSNSLQVKIVGPMLADGSGPYMMPIGSAPEGVPAADFLPPPTCNQATDIRTAGSSGVLLVDLHFEKIASGFHRRRYFVDVELTYRENSPVRDLGSTRVRFEVVRLNPQQLLQAFPVSD